MKKEFKKWLQESGIKHELTVAYSLESNGTAERLNRTLLDTARNLLHDARNIPHHEQLWAEAVNTACYIRKRLHSTATLAYGKTPHEMLLNKKPDLSHVRMFASKAFVHTPKARRKGKLDHRALIGYPVGFERVNSYRVSLSDEGKIVSSRDLSFDESIVIHPNNEGKKEGNDGTVEFEYPFTPFLRM